jgi:hypothetical protein
MEKFECHSLLKQLNEKKKNIFDDVMHRKQLYHDIMICLFLTWGKTFTLKHIIQRLLWLYNRDIFFDLTKTKVLLMALIGKLPSILMV